MTNWVERRCFEVAASWHNAGEQLSWPTRPLEVLGYPKGPGASVRRRVITVQGLGRVVSRFWAVRVVIAALLIAAGSPGFPATTAHASGPWTFAATADFNGDGKADIAQFNSTTGQWLVRQSTGTGFNTSLWATWSSSVTWVDLRVGDFNGDGRADIAGRDLSTGQWWVGLSTGSSFVSSVWTTWSPPVTWVDVRVGDFSADRKAAIAGRELSTGQWFVGLSTGSSFVNTLWTTWSASVTWVDVRVGDFNGDGKADIAGRDISTGQWWVGLSTGSAFNTSLWTTWSPSVTWVDVQVGDFNGDGKADIAGRELSTGQWFVGLSTGSSFVNALWTTWSASVTWADVQVGDFNGDGKADIAGRDTSTGQWFVGLSTGASFNTSLWATWNPNVTWSPVLAGDFNGDGRADIAGFYSAADKWWVGLSTGSRFDSPSTVALPALSNGAYGGYVSAAYIQNTGTQLASVSVSYLDQSGATAGVGDVNISLAPNATWIVRQDNGHAFSAGQAGSGVVVSTQPVAAFVNECAPSASDVTSYTGAAFATEVGSTVFAPAIANNAYGGYITGIGLMNLATSPANISVTYRDSSGTVVKTQPLNGVAAGAYQGLYSGDPGLGLPNGFAGTATITSSAGNLAAVVNETGPGGQFSSYDAVPAGSTALYGPVALNNAFGGYNTGMGIQNTTGSAGTVTITYYDSTGTATVKTSPVVAHGYLGVYQGTDIPTAGAYTARLTSSVAIAAIVNEVAPSNTSAQQSTAYNTFVAGSSSLNLPLVESAGADGWSTGEGIMNTGVVSTTVTVNYYDTGTGAAVGTPQTQTLAPHAFWGLYQPTGGLSNGTRASAVVTTGLGGLVAVICNESNGTSFMSYNAQ